MRQIMQSRAIRSLCYALILALIATIAPTPLMKPACAQVVPISVGVVDFTNESGVQGDVLARIATDAVVVEMSKTSMYDVSITRTMMKSKMEELGIHAPLNRVDMIRLGEGLSTDAMLEGVIKSVQITGSGSNRRASVTLVMQMIDQASGEIINGAVQTGTSNMRVGFTADDNTLINDAINSAAFLAVKTMTGYVIPEATIMMQVGEGEVMLNKGIRDGIKAGMRMIVLREKDVIGYIEVREVNASDSQAKVIKSMKGIHPEDKCRAIFEMPTVVSSLKSAPLPSSAPPGSTSRKGAASKIAKFFVGAAIVFGLVSMFKGGRGVEDVGSITASDNMEISWDTSKFNQGGNVYELQIVRDATSNPTVVWETTSPSIWGLGHVNLRYLYDTTSASSFTVNYYDLPSGTTTPVAETSTFTNEGYGQTHTYQVRVIYYRTSTDSDGNETTTYTMTSFSNVITATAVEEVTSSMIVEPADGEELIVSQLTASSDPANFIWTHTSGYGANEYKIHMEPVVPGGGPTWDSPVIYWQTGDQVSLSQALRYTVASKLSSSAYEGNTMRWRIDSRHGSPDTSSAWVTGEWARFVISSTPPGPDD